MHSRIRRTTGEFGWTRQLLQLWMSDFGIIISLTSSNTLSTILIHKYIKNGLCTYVQVGSLIKKSVTDYHQSTGQYWYIHTKHPFLHCSFTGDGTKKMLLALRGALEEVL